MTDELERMWNWSLSNLRSWIWHLPGEMWVNLTIVGVLTKIWTERCPDMSKVLLFEPLWFVHFHYNSLHFRTIIQSCLQSHFKISYRIFLCLAVRILWLFVCTVFIKDWFHIELLLEDITLTVHWRLLKQAILHRSKRKTNECGTDTKKTVALTSSGKKSRKSPMRIRQVFRRSAGKGEDCTDFPTPASPVTTGALFGIPLNRLGDPDTVPQPVMVPLTLNFIGVALL